MGFVIIKEYTYATEAYIDRGYLDSNNIITDIQGENFASIYPGISSIASVSLAVDEADVEKAKKLLGIE